jgi:mono/diheme cytochrome c family protein
MRKGWKFPLVIELTIAAFVLGLVIAACLLMRAVRYGFSAHDEPMAMEAMMAGRMRHWSVPADLHKLRNPLPLTPEILTEARAHYADHCASCHGNDGKGKTEIGQHLYPRAPDMTLSETQNLSDGELFATIENGVRLTGMPGWGNGTAESAYGSWTLVHFIRHLPKVTPAEVEEMKKMNPMTPSEMQEQQSEELFLEGGDASAPPEQPHHNH